MMSFWYEIRAGKKLVGSAKVKMVSKNKNRISCEHKINETMKKEKKHKKYNM